ncbi:MAG TPA: XrtA/PEP-CTERM system TPR-repeat protein PrsT [Steroidobacteraceae bacterium]|jgi:putative PEP-CTERM system TPR-repeat lipoprotein
MRGSRLSLVVIAIGLVLAACDVWVSPQTRVERAQQQLDKANYRAAMTDLKTALEAEPDNIAGRVLLARLSLQLGDIQSAEKELERAVRSGAKPEQVAELQYETLLAQQRLDDLAKLLEKPTLPPNRHALYRSRLQSAQGKAAEAEQTLKTALAAAPEDADLLLESARLAAARGDLQPAMDLPERIAKSPGAHVRALMLRGSIRLVRGQHREALDELLKAQENGRTVLSIPEKLTLATYITEAHLALEDPDAADHSLAMLDQWAPQVATTHYLHARIAMLKRDPATVVTECQKALRADPQHMQAQLLLAAAHLGQGSLEQAEETLDRLLATQDNLAARKLLAQVHLARGQPQRAQAVLNTVMGNADRDPQLDWLMGSALLQSGSANALQHMERGIAAMPDSVDRRIELATAYLAARQPAKAIEILSAVPKDSPSSPRAKGLLVLATAAGKSPAEARREIDNLIAKSQDDPALLTAAGTYLAAGSDLGKSRALLERAIQLDPKATSAHMALARLLIRLRDLSGAEVQLKQVVSNDTKNQPARLGLSELAWAQGDKDGSRKWLEDAISVDPSAVEARLRLAQMAFISGDANRGRDLLNQAVDVAEDRKNALNGSGKVLARAGLSDEALTKFRAAAAEGLPEGDLNAARLQLDLNRPEQARKLLESALARTPDWREASQLLIQVDARTGQVDRALTRARALAANAPPEALSEIEGDVYAVAGKASQAIAAYESAQKKRPTSALALKLFDVRRTAKMQPAEVSLTQWLERSPADVEVRQLLAGYYEGTGRNDDAIAQYEQLAAQKPPDPAVLNNLAWLLHEKGDERALAMAQQAHQAAPKVPEIADTYGWILVQHNQAAEGLDVLQAALSGSPGNPDIQYHVAAAYAKSGQQQKAAELLRQSLKSGKAFRERAAAESLLSSIHGSGV